ncbi:SagB family peptide dehydrogenase [Streptomyces sp. NPDC087218]|uniref:SagB/ThcOx family dehydrogenase n=1 Tax=Streptomyces sp. NPDC087218 TaxID=3365769 RepID=UPI00381FA648
MKTATPRIRTRLSFVTGVSVLTEHDTLEVNRDGRTQFRIRRAHPDVAAALRGMAEPGGHGGPDTALPAPVEKQLALVTSRLGRLLERYVSLGGTEVLRLESMADGDGAVPAEVGADTVVRLDRFALLRSHEGDLVLESPLSPCRARLRAAPLPALAGALGAGTTARAQAGALGLPVEVIQQLLGHLTGAGLAEAAGPAGGFASDRDEVRRQWDFHDLLFHARSRLGRHDYPFGGVFPYRGTIEPRPAVKPVPPGPAVELPRPRLEELTAADPGLTTVLEGRRSIRAHAAEPLDLARLGEFLYRTARVRSLTGQRLDQGLPYAASSRPYPTGGAGYDLELYVTVHRCAGLEPGIYFYDPAGHRLSLVNADPRDRRAMLRVAEVSAGDIATPDLLITITSRFQRLAWKYKSIAYSATLKNVGVLYQTMYLVATAMGLAPCALGGGDSDLAARVLGLDYLQEGSVGEFLLGSRPAPDRLPPAGHVGWEETNDAAWHARCDQELTGTRAARAVDTGHAGPDRAADFLPGITT